MRPRRKRQLCVFFGSLPLLLLLLCVADHPLVGAWIWMIVLFVAIFAPSLLRGR
jgi:hypothetical protein